MTSLSLSDIAALVSGRLANAVSGVACTKVTATSAQADPGAVFVAVRGHAADGHTFVPDAFSHGASAAVVEDERVLGSRPGIVVENSRLALSRLASAFAGDPSRTLRVIGVTGTNGKTTTNWMIYHALNAVGIGTLRIGTLGSECMGKGTKEGALTSPDPVSLHLMMQDARNAGARACVMETSSHALDQARVEDVQFDVGIFTNLTRDHLDYHKTFERYFEAKARLFELLSKGPKPTRAAVINVDDEYGNRLWRDSRTATLADFTFGRSEAAAYRIGQVTESSGKTSIVITVRDRGESAELSIPFVGAHNVENAVAAYAACLALGCDSTKLADAFASIPQVPGRLELVGHGAPRIFVDYAHTPDALERALKAVRVTNRGTLWVVFGCGGDRDKGKRPEMARVSAALADRVVVTSDNPRTEDPEAIIRDILSSGITPAVVEVDRRAAIRRAALEAASEDTILVAGKGHEDYQIIGRTKIHFSDQEVAREALAERKPPSA
jgi:UDP-N-acetylmuramoyl-L-alanyl-D-glutamate--2,6-diaminopimelate ligase